MQRMRYAIGLGLGSVLATVLVASSVQAQCAFPHGQNTGANGYARMTQAFVPCGNPDCDGYPPMPPNDSNIAGWPSCSPPQTYHQAAGSPVNGWVLDGISGRARFRMNQMSGPDIGIQFQLRDVRDGAGLFPTVGTTGSLYLVLRMTVNDTGNGDMTQIDMPISIPVVIGNATGDSNVSTTLNALLVSMGQPPMPSCTNTELIDAAVFDPAFNKFLRISHFRL